MNEIYEFGPFTLEVRERRLSASGRLIPLRPKVFDTLRVLVEHHGCLVEKDELMKLVWPGTVVEENNLALNMTVLRKALGVADSSAKWIETVTGKGYRFKGEVRAGSSRSQVRSAPDDFGGGTNDRDQEATLLERKEELAAIREALDAALRGKRQFVCITGEAGIGKTSLLQSFLSEASSRDSSLIIGKGQCVEHAGEGEAYMPVLEILGKLCRSGQHASVVRDFVERYAPSWLVQLPFLIDPRQYPLLRERLLGVTRDRMLRELAEALEAIADKCSLVIILEDLHWADPSTLELLSALSRRQESARILVIGTNRGRDAGEAGRALEALTEELQLRGQCEMIRPKVLGEASIEALMRTRMPGSRVAPQLLTDIRQRTSGNPLFIHAIVDHWMEHGAGDVLPTSVPGNLTAMIQRKLEVVRREDKELLECASMIGMTFPSAIVAHVLERSEDEIDIRCSSAGTSGTILLDAGLTEWPDGTASSSFAFRHSLYQEALYAQIPLGRRSRLHRLIGEVLQNVYRETATQHAVELAHHFTEGRDPERAIVYLEAAAEAALQRSAPREAAVHLRRGLNLMRSLPDSVENRSREFRLLAMFAPTVIATEGFASADAEPSYERAFELGRQLGDMERAYPVLLGRAFMHELRGEYHRTEELLGKHMSLPESLQNSMAAVHADSLMACSLFHQGKFTGALERAEHGLGIYDPSRDRDFLAPHGENPSIACQSWSALCLWFLGFPDRAVDRSLRLVKFSEEPGHRFAYSTAALYAMHVYQLRRETQEALRWAEATLHSAETQGYLYNSAFAKVVKGWALAMGGAIDDGLLLVKQGLQVMEAIGAKLDRPYLLALGAEVQLAAGRHQAAIEFVIEAIKLVQASRTFFYEAELYRLRAAVISAMNGRNASTQAEHDLRHALDLARRQGSLSLELRIAASLAELLIERGRAKSGLEILQPIYSTFEEGHATPDLRHAEALIAANR